MRSEIDFNGVTYPVFYYGIDNCSHYEWRGEDFVYTAPMLHLFGEMDLPLDMTWEQARGIAFNAAECCGYSVSWNEKDLSIWVGGDTKAYEVYYGDQGGIFNVVDVTIQSQIKVLESWNDTWYRRIRSIELLGVDPHDKRAPADYLVYIDENNRKIAQLKEKLNVQNRNS